MFKPGSRKASVYSRFQEKGVVEALALGVSLGLAEGSVRGWLSKWSKGKVDLPKRSAQRIPKPVIAKNRIHHKSDKTWTGTILIRGEEQSEVKWDGEGFGVHCWPNTDLVEIGEE